MESILKVFHHYKFVEFVPNQTYLVVPRHMTVEANETQEQARVQCAAASTVRVTSKITNIPWRFQRGSAERRCPKILVFFILSVEVYPGTGGTSSHSSHFYNATGVTVVKHSNPVTVAPHTGCKGTQ